MNAVQPDLESQVNCSESSLVLHHFTEAANSDSLPFVLLHGWGSDSTVFHQLIEQLCRQQTVIAVDLPGFGNCQPWLDFSLEGVLKALERQLPDRFNLMGWSLGGMIATAFAANHEDRVNKLITLACNASFVEHQSWPAAMPQSVYRQFCEFFNDDWLACLKHFCGLQAKGDCRQRELTRQLRALTEAQDLSAGLVASNWRNALALLGEIDNRKLFTELTVPGLHLFGGADALVPAEVAQLLMELNPEQKTEVLPNVAHCLHLSEHHAVCSLIEQFLVQPSPGLNKAVSDIQKLDKRRVAESFSRAAISYDDAAAFQRKIADQLIARMPPELSPAHVLDVGSGTGYLTGVMQQNYPDTMLTAVDIAPGMLDFAREHRSIIGNWVCGDAESLPLADASVDLLVSNLAYQWCDSPGAWIAEIRRLLTSNGVAMFSTFGVNTLQELKSAWQQVDQFVHVNKFVNIDELEQKFAAEGLPCELISETHVLNYPDLKTLMRELKDLGAHNINQGRNNALTGRRRLQQLTHAYERFRDGNGQLPATYEVIYGVVRFG